MRSSPTELYFLPDESATNRQIIALALSADAWTAEEKADNQKTASIVGGIVEPVAGFSG